MDDWVNVTRNRVRRNREVQIGLARQALATSKPAQAIAATGEILNHQADDVEALSIRAGALVAAKRYEEAEGTYAKLVQLQPEDIRMRYNYAVVLSRLRRFGEAVRQYEHVLAKQPGHAKAAYNLAVIHQDEGRLTDAARLWKQVTEANPGLASAWFRQGTVAMQLGDHETAAAGFAQSERLEPGRPDTMTNLGTALHQLGRLAEAIEAFQRAREADPDFLPAANGIADVYVGYAEKNPNAEDHFQCGLRWCAYSLGRKPYQPELAALYRRLLKVRPQSTEALNGLAGVLAATPQDAPQHGAKRQEAVRLLEESLELKADQPKAKELLDRLKSG
ncbi:MAG: tetratricopeptide repeat protein [Phycisphaerae bacterium]|nr:tetratricopeptide repeat protein [Phycisphaerae bacterium]